MKLKYEAHKNQRFKNGGLHSKYKNGKKRSYKKAFLDATTYDGYWYVMYQNRVGIWLNYDQYYELDKSITIGSSSHSPVSSIRAFRRKLKQWSKYLPSNTNFILVSRLIGCNVYGKTK